MTDISTETKVLDLPHVGPAYCAKLEKLGIISILDLLYHLPSRYEYYEPVSSISGIRANQSISVKGIIADIKNVFTKNGKRLTQATLIDPTGSIDIIWFNQIFLTRVIRKNTEWIISGKVDFFGRKIAIISPTYEPLNNNSTSVNSGLVPIYPETEGVTSKWIRNKIAWYLKNYKNTIKDFLPDEVILKNNLLTLPDALQNIHFPKTLTEAEIAKKRIAFEELFLLQLNGLEQRKKRLEEKNGYPLQVDKFTNMIKSLTDTLPFKLTPSQNTAISEIIDDLKKTSPMNRLLEGDVGSGKTIVAGIAAYLACLNQTQVAFMAPTEILAQQHFQTLDRILTPLGVQVFLLTSSIKNVPQDFDFSKPFIAVGTHSLLFDNLKFSKLSLVIIDEQHRFGVNQRLTLTKKGDNPHVLTMTATPIPRTIALCFYGDLDLSVLNEMPTGRKKIKTWVVTEEKRVKAYEWIKKNLARVFVVCPIIEESENLQSVKAVTKEYEKLQKIFSDFSVGLLHGKLKNNEKNEILSKFKSGKIQILVSTPVVEVGIDIPEANIILIEAADRFGLAQLHQLRGRVGRNNQDAYCLLFPSDEELANVQRLKYLESVFSGPELAEIDLSLRGAGDLWGQKQHGEINLKAANILDKDMILLTKNAATHILSNNWQELYPRLNKKVQNLRNDEFNPN